MLKAELIAKLAKYPDDTDIMLLDGENGAGHPREISIGPYEHTINEGNENWTFDCENRTGQKVVVLGFGSY